VSLAIGENFVATVRTVVNFRVEPSRYADLFEGVKAVKKIIQRLGATLVVNRQYTGPETGNIIAKAASDPELSGLIDTMRNNPNPAWEGLTVALNEEVAL
jgi:hypothetical protein